MPRFANTGASMGLCNKPVLHPYVSIKPEQGFYLNGTQVLFSCKPPSEVGSAVPLRHFGSEWAFCNGTINKWQYQFRNHAPHCESDTQDFESKVQIAVTAFSCTIMACLVFLMFTFGFKAFNYRRAYKNSKSRKPPSYRDVILNPNAYYSRDSLHTSSTSTIFTTQSELTENTNHKQPLLEQTPTQNRQIPGRPARHMCRSSASSSATSLELARVGYLHSHSPRVKKVSFSDEVMLEVDENNQQPPPPFSKVKLKNTTSLQLSQP